VTTILAIDPGNGQSAYVTIDHDLRPVRFAKIQNRHLVDALREEPVLAADRFAIEMVASYGMSVGADIFETCVWIGRFAEAIALRTGHEPFLITRHPVKLHHCHDSRAKDSNIVQALVDRFAPGQPNRGKGTKAEPGWFHGFHSDLWQAYSLAVYAADMEMAP
jgi:hypothetical protein